METVDGSELSAASTAVASQDTAKVDVPEETSTVYTGVETAVLYKMESCLPKAGEKCPLGAVESDRCNETFTVQIRREIESKGVSTGMQSPSCIPLAGRQSADISKGELEHARSYEYTKYNPSGHVQLFSAFSIPYERRGIDEESFRDSADMYFKEVPKPASPEAPHIVSCFSMADENDVSSVLNQDVCWESYTWPTLPAEVPGVPPCLIAQADIKEELQDDDDVKVKFESIDDYD
jgi:hypothetical protein